MTTTSELDRDLPARVTRLAENGPGLAMLSAMESTILPIPLESVLVPLMISHPRQAMRIALWALCGCLIGSLALYGAGLLAQPLVDPVLSWLGLTEGFAQMQHRLAGGTLFWTVMIVSLSPAPMQLASLGAGVAASNVVIFLAAILVSRGIRYVGLAVLAQSLGPKLTQMGIPPWVLMLIPVIIICGVMVL